MGTVFLRGEHPHAGELARGFVEFHRFTAISSKLPLVDALVGAALLAAQVNGSERAGHMPGTSLPGWSATPKRCARSRIMQPNGASWCRASPYRIGCW